LREREQAEPQHFTSFDGTRIAYYDTGSGPAIVLANGLGGTFSSWRFVTEKLAKKYRFVSWDYRSLYHSEHPPDESIESFSIENQARDLECLLDHLKIERAILFGWSMGTQLILEFYRRAPKRVAGLGLICGTAGKPFDSALGFKPSRYIIPKVFQFFRKYHRPLEVAAKVTSSFPGFVYVWRYLGFVSASGDVEAFRELYKEVGKIDFKSYSETMLMLGEHDAWDVLPNIKVPTVIFAGERDFFTPTDVARKIHELIPKNKFVLIPKSSHYAPLEYPDLFIDEIDDFIKRCLKRKGSKPRNRQARPRHKRSSP